MIPAAWIPRCYHDRMIARIIRALIPKRFRPIGYMENLTETETGHCVATGPFAGMRYTAGSVGSAYIPKLLGIYERELNGFVEKACALSFSLIVDIGAAEGYYAVGFARRNPKVRIIAFEVDAKGRAALCEMAVLNDIRCVEKGIGGSMGHEAGSLSKEENSNSHGSEQRPQLEVYGKCEVENLQSALASAERPLVVCDVEGYEDVLLFPEKIPALARAHLLVEMHDFCCPGITERITARFAPTHRIERIWQEPRARDDFPFSSLGTKLLPSRYLDWAVNEWRPERMSWLWMEPKAETRN